MFFCYLLLPFVQKKCIAFKHVVYILFILFYLGLNIIFSDFDFLKNVVLVDVNPSARTASKVTSRGVGSY
jgi:hypothetical protein